MQCKKKQLWNTPIRFYKLVLKKNKYAFKVQLVEIEKGIKKIFLVYFMKKYNLFMHLN